MFDTAVKQQICSGVARLHTPGQALTQDFYGRVFSAAPELRSLFPNDMAAQSDKLFDMILVLVQSLDHIQMLVTEIEALGRRHVDYGVRDAHYPLIAEQLLATLAQHVDNWSDDDQAAWSELLEYVADLMITGARSYGAASA